MAFTIQKMAAIVWILTSLSFAFGLAAFYKKDPKTVYDSTSATLVYLCVAFLLASSVAGFLSWFYPYKGMSVPLKVLFIDMDALGLGVVFFTVLSTVLSAWMLLFSTIMEHEISLEVHNNSSAVANNIAGSYSLLFGGVMLSLDSGLLWLATLLFVHMVREEYFRRNNNNNNDLNNGAEIAILL